MEKKPQIEKLGKIYKKSERAVFILTDEKNIKNTLKNLKELGFQRVVSISGYDNGKNIEVVYQFNFNARVINIKILLNRNNPKIESVTRYFPGAELYERELAEMLGVEVLKHPDPGYLFLDKTSPRRPLRRKDETKKQ